MAMALVQSVLGGNVTATNTTPFTLTTSAVGFASTTGAGNLLVLVAYGKEHSHTGGGFTGITFQNPTTSGITWVDASVFNAYNFNGVTDGGGFRVWYAANAPSIAPAATTTVQANLGGAGVSDDLSVEFALYEFSGIPAALIDVRKTPGASTGTPGVGSLTTTATDLVLVMFHGNSANDTAGAGYTLGVSMAVATTGQLQYALDVAAGTQATAFTGSQTNFAAGAVGFKAGVVPPTITPQVVPSAVNAGQSATLSWTSTNATTVTVDQGIGSVSTSGSLLVNPSVTTTYNFTATGPGGTALGQATLAINPSISNFDLQKLILSVKESNIPVRGRNQ